MILAALLLASSGPLTLPAWTSVKLATQVAIDSRSVRQGQRFALTLTEDIKLGERVVIPRGTPAVGEVETVSKSSTGGNAGKLVLAPLFIEWRGERIYLRGRQESNGKSAVGASVATQVILSPLGILISGRSATVPAGSVLDGEVRSDVTVVPAP